ncbi:MAG: MATE family efflux transporter, partial [Bacteroidaceae bacterium]|nr:MATE family efflux transporter [Bacteroidaceae bacterium]
MAEQKTPTELGTRPVGKLLLEYAIPAIIAMTASSLYNLVDSIFIGQGVGAMAISGLAVTHPIMNVSAAFGAMVGVGGSALISLKLGQRDNKTAQLILGNVVILNIILGVLLGGLCLIFMKEVLTFFGATPGLMPYAYDYMMVIMFGNVITHLYMGLNSVLRSAGHPRKAMGATMFTVLINCVLDPIF